MSSYCEESGMPRLSRQALQDLAKLAGVPAENLRDFGAKLQALIDGWDEIARTYQLSRWDPRGDLWVLDGIDKKLKNLRAAVGAAGIRANRWVGETSKGEQRDLAFYDKQLHEMEEHLKKTRNALSVMKKPPHRPKTGIAGPNSMPSEWFAAEVYAIAIRYGGTLNVNKDGKGAVDHPEGRFGAFLERMRDFLPPNVSVPASPRALDKIRTEMDKKLRQLACT